MKREQYFSGAVLKHFAMVCMLADHVDKAFLMPCVEAGAALWLEIFHGVLKAIGRFAFPIFFFLLIEGFYNTGNRWKYMRNLSLFALVSEIPFDMFVSTNLLDLDSQNIYFTLAVSLGAIWGIDAVRERTKYWILLTVPIVLVGCFAAEFGQLDYGGRGILISLAFYLFRSKPVVASLTGYLVVAKEIWSLPSFLLTSLYNGQRGRQCKWLNYWFYPLHLLIIGGIRLILKA